MKFLRVPPEKWKRYQHYHDERDYVWIKLYTQLLDEDKDVDYSLLPDAAKLLLHHVWMLAARTKNRIPYNREWISKKKLNVRSSINLKPLLAAGFVEIFESAIDDFLVPPLDDSQDSHACLESDSLKSLSPKGESEGEGFEEAWRDYPRRIGKGDAQRHYRAQVKSRSDHQALLSAIRNYRREIELLGTEEQFVKHGSSFFNGRWRDYVDGVWKPPTKAKAPAAKTPAIPRTFEKDL